MFKTSVMLILDYVNLVPLISIHIIPEESQYVVDVMRCMHTINPDILTLIQLLCLRLVLDDGAYHAETSTKDGHDGTPY